MIVAMQEVADEAQIQQVIEHLVKMGFEVHRSTGARMTVLGAVGSGIDFDIRNPGIAAGGAGSPPHQFSLQARGPKFSSGRDGRQVANGIGVGGNEVVVMAGPCSVEIAGADFLHRGGGGEGGRESLRGGAFKPRSSPYSFQGHGRRCAEVAA